MRFKTIKKTALLLCLCISSFLHGQISIDYFENKTVECGTDLTPSVENAIIGYPDISTTCENGLSDITYSDNIDGLTNCGSTGILLRFWSVSDNCGGFMTLLQRITLEDTTPPEINCLSDIIIECDASLNPTENPDLNFPEINDCSIGEDLSITYIDQNEGIGFCDGLPEIVRRTWTVTDACGNESTCEQKIRVGKDPLLIFCEIEDITHECNGLDGSRFAAESWDLSNINQLRNCTQTDCGPVEIISDFDYGRISGSCSITGNLKVNYLIKDNCGNSKFKIVTFTLRDTTPPESFCNPVDFGVSCEGDETAASRVATWHAENISLLETCLFDNCGEVRVTSDFNASNFDINQLTFDCSDTIGFAVNYMLTDDCGNQKIKTASLKIVDNSAPTFENVPRDTSIGANDNLPPTQPTVLDNCSTGLNANLAEERIDNNNDDGYRIIRKWTATDDCGNIGTASQTIMVLDPILSLACSSAAVKLEGNIINISNLLAPNEIVKVFASDNRVVYNCFRNCGEVQSTRPLAEDTYDVDIEFYTENWRFICSKNVTITVGSADSGGGNPDGGGENEDPCSATECETTPPTISNLAADMTVNFDEVPNVENPVATDNCDTAVEITFNEIRIPMAIGSENINNYVLTRTWIATDDCGNTTSGNQVIRVIDDNSIADGGNGDDGGNNGDGANDNTDPCLGTDCETTPPIIANFPSDLTVNFDEVPAPASPIATDNCDTAVELSISESISESIDARNYTLTRTWTAVDDCKNETTRKQVIIVIESNVDGGDNSDGGTDEGGNAGGDTVQDSSICDAVIISTAPSIFNFSNLNAPNKIVKIFDLEYNILLECNSNCGTALSFDYETAGSYIADVQLYTANWDFICETSTTLELSTNPIDTMPADIKPQSDDCATVEILIQNGLIEVNNVNTPNQLIKLFDEDYGIITECANNCSNPITFDLPPVGNYFVDVQLYTANWDFICKRQEAISITENEIVDNEGNNENEGENSNESPCETVNINHSSSNISISNFNFTNKIVHIFDANYNQIYTCFTDCPGEVDATIDQTGIYYVDIQLYDDDWNLACQNRTIIEIVENSTNEENNEMIADCAAVQITASNKQISISNITIINAIVKVFNKNYDLIYECIGDCGNEVIVADLVDGDYKVNINYFGENWQPKCERIESVLLNSNLVNPNNPTINSPNSTFKINPAIFPIHFEMYPNPARNELILETPNFIGQKISVTVYNQLATSVLHRRFDATELGQRLDISQLQSGLYMLYVEVEGQAPLAKKLLVN